MFTISRLQEIVKLLNEKKAITVRELSERFYISETTIRRDLEKLDKQGIIKKTYGGAVLIEGLDSEIPLYVRESEQRDEKEIIGKLASRLVKDNDIITMDSSSTTLKMVPYLKNIENLTVITNGAKTAILLGEQLHTEIYCTGGKLRENSLSYIGDSARKSINSFYVNLLFFSCKALSFENGFYDTNPSEAELRRDMISHSKKTILLCDDSKFDNISFCKIGDFNQLHAVVTNKKPSDKWIDYFNLQGIDLIYE